MQQLKAQMQKKQEYRGLTCDDVSFMEIRRKGKRRKKYLVKEVLGEGQLFPMIPIELIDFSVLEAAPITVIVKSVVIGKIGTFVYEHNSPFKLDFLFGHIVKRGCFQNSDDKDAVLISHYNHIPVTFVSEDVVLRGSSIIFEKKKSCM
jgi:hypothetical protein